jgi:Domain of unknown function (DUF6531)
LKTRFYFHQSFLLLLFLCCLGITGTVFADDPGESEIPRHKDEGGAPGSTASQLVTIIGRRYIAPTFGPISIAQIFGHASTPSTPSSNNNAGGPGGGEGGPIGNGSTDEEKKDPPSDDNSKERCGETTDNPVVLSTGEKVLPQVDAELSNIHGFSVQRNYRSRNISGIAFGPNWLSSLDGPRITWSGWQCDVDNICAPQF